MSYHRPPPLDASRIRPRPTPFDGRTSSSPVLHGAAAPATAPPRLPLHRHASSPGSSRAVGVPTVHRASLGLFGSKKTSQAPIKSPAGGYPLYPYPTSPAVSKEEAKRTQELVSEHTTGMMTAMRARGYLELTDDERYIWKSVPGGKDDWRFTPEDLKTGPGRSAFAKMALTAAKRDLAAERAPADPMEKGHGRAAEGFGQATPRTPGREGARTPHDVGDTILTPSTQEDPITSYSYDIGVTVEGRYGGRGAVDEPILGNDAFPTHDPDDSLPPSYREFNESTGSTPRYRSAEFEGDDTFKSARPSPANRTDSRPEPSPVQAKGRGRSSSNAKPAAPTRGRTQSVSQPTRPPSRSASVDRNAALTVDAKKQLLNEKKLEQARIERERTEMLQQNLREAKEQQAEKDRREQEIKDRARAEKEAARLQKQSYWRDETASHAFERKARMDKLREALVGTDEDIPSPDWRGRNSSGRGYADIPSSKYPRSTPASAPPSPAIGRSRTTATTFTFDDAPPDTPDVIALPYLHFNIGHRSVRLLIDSGAQISLIQPKLRRSLGISCRKAPGHLNGVTGSGACEGICEGEDGDGVKLVPEGMENLVTRAKMVSGPCGQMSDGILGMPWIVSAKAEIRYEADEGVIVSFDAERDDGTKQRVTLCATGEQEIRRGSFWTTTGISPFPEARPDSRKESRREARVYPVGVPLQSVTLPPRSAPATGPSPLRFEVDGRQNPLFLSRVRTLSNRPQLGAKAFRPGDRARARTRKRSM